VGLLAVALLAALLATLLTYVLDLADLLVTCHEVSPCGLFREKPIKMAPHRIFRYWSLSIILHDAGYEHLG